MSISHPAAPPGTNPATSAATEDGSVSDIRVPSSNTNGKTTASPCGVEGGRNIEAPGGSNSADGRETNCGVHAGATNTTKVAAMAIRSLIRPPFVSCDVATRSFVQVFAMSTSTFGLGFAVSAF
jgi:hypothetical protein